MIAYVIYGQARMLVHCCYLCYEVNNYCCLSICIHCVGMISQMLVAEFQ